MPKNIFSLKVIMREQSDKSRMWDSLKTLPKNSVMRGKNGLDRVMQNLTTKSNLNVIFWLIAINTFILDNLEI